jgi:putative IMPACT (imprinted ancient) family translation regulator
VIEHCHDDGEPSGTAGRPALAVLRGSGLGDVVCVVTRYFGGTKLGKGGLVRAYGDAVREVLKDAPLARKAATDLVETVIPYSFFERVRLLAAELGGLSTGETFGAEVTLLTRFPAERTEEYRARVSDLTHGKGTAAVLSHDPETILPL